MRGFHVELMCDPQSKFMVEARWWISMAAEMGATAPPPIPDYRGLSS